MKCPNCQTENPNTARFCMYCGQAFRTRTPEDEDRLSRLAASVPDPLAEKVRSASGLAGERRQVTVLFLDVVGSTTLAEQLGKDTWLAIINSAYDQIAPVIYRYEGTIARTLGDSLVAFFGAPLAHEDDPLRAVLAALDALEVARHYARQVHQEYAIDFAMRACLNHGPVQVGAISADLRYEYTSLSGAINLAARLKFAAQPFKPLLSESVYRFTAPYFDFLDQGAIEVKGQPAPLRAYQVAGRKTKPGSLRGLAGLQSPMVGREAEISALFNLCEAVRAGLGRAVLIVGEPGLGKTRLIAEWQAAVARRNQLPTLQWAECGNPSYAQGMAYHLLNKLVYALLGLEKSASELQTHSALSAVISDLLGDPQAPQNLEIYAPLGHLLSLKLEGAALDYLCCLDTQAVQARYRSATSQLIEALAARRPLVIVLEDVHWADPSSVEVFSKLLPLVLTSPVLFCLVSRLDRDAPGWKLVNTAREYLGSSLTELTLEALPEAEARKLVANLLEIEDLPEKLRSMILKKAEGNPFFVEEIIRILIERGAIIAKEDGWKAGADLSQIEIPDNLHGLLMSRIDRLPDQDRHTLRVASVVGRQFPVRVLAQVLAFDSPQDSITHTGTMSTLGTLENAGLVRMAHVEPELEYLFRHTLVQEAAYATLLANDRQRLHLAVGQIVEKLYPDSLEENAARLAHHFNEANQDTQALKYFTLAGQAALNSYANQEAEAYYRKALQLPCEKPQCIELFSGLAEARYRQGYTQEAIKTWLQGAELALAAGDFERVARLYSSAARAAWHGGDTPGGLELCQQALALVETAPESQDMARLLHETARAYFFNGLPDQASPLCHQALEMAERLGAVEVLADALATFGVLPDQPAEAAIKALERSVELTEAHQLLQIAVRAHHNLALVMRGLLGDNLGARPHYLRAVELARKRGVIREELISLGEFIGMSLTMGDFAEVERALLEMNKLVAILPSREATQSDPGMLKAGLLGLRGEWAEAIQAVRVYQAKARQSGDLQGVFNTGSFMAVMLLEQNYFKEEVELDALAQVIQESIEIGDRGIGENMGPRTRMSILYSRRGRLEEARLMLEQARQAAGARISIWSQAFIASAEAELAFAESRWQEAITACETLVEIQARTGQRWEWARGLLNLADVHTARGEPADLTRAQSLYSLALDLFTKIGAPGYIKIIEKRLLSLQIQAESQAIAAQEVTREMAQAGKIQSSFLPERIPELPGWELAAILEPARQTSGDYYDFIPLPGGFLGIVIADVTDKGAGAALYMASSRTLIRTFAEIYPAQPEEVMAATNRRLLLDTHGGLFVTVFYGILDLATGSLVYCNAGHNPPYLFKAQSPRSFNALTPTSIALGIIEEAHWGKSSQQLDPGDVLVLYTDGAIDALSESQVLFGDQRLLASIRANLGDEHGQARSARQVHRAVLADIHQFAGSAPRPDDLTLIVLRRET
ncbi:MAG TPA: SpoIIE family protein phosphatase [Anaerolineales bacterium]|nr:SpoIIE family protein phosphatase [Anaerolineales bacterium]